MSSSFQFPNQPLADRMRPLTLDDYIGQEHLVGPQGALTLQILTGTIPSMIFWGPPPAPPRGTPVCGRSTRSTRSRTRSRSLSGSSTRSRFWSRSRS